MIRAQMTATLVVAAQQEGQEEEATTRAHHQAHISKAHAQVPPHHITHVQTRATTTAMESAPLPPPITDMDPRPRAIMDDPPLRRRVDRRLRLRRREMQATEMRCGGCLGQWIKIRAARSQKQNFEQHL